LCGISTLNFPRQFAVYPARVDWGLTIPQAKDPRAVRFFLTVILGRIYKEAFWAVADPDAFLAIQGAFLTSVTDDINCCILMVFAFAPQEPSVFLQKNLTFPLCVAIL